MGRGLTLPQEALALSQQMFSQIWEGRSRCPWAARQGLPRGQRSG